MTLSRRQIWILAIVLVSLLLLSLVLAPSGGRLRLGSTYSRSPDGYAAWYAHMEKHGVPIQRWKRPLKELESTSAPVTLVQVRNGIDRLTIFNQDWVSKGNVLVLLGVRTPATRAPFSSRISSPVGTVKIDTSRRSDSQSALLADSFGAVVWQETIGKGEVIYASTPFLAANAYQEFPGNFKYLEKLVTEPGKSIYIDEYLHGYRDVDVARKEASGNVVSYLAKTPLSLLAIQALVMLAVLLFGQNQRLGRTIALTTPTEDNSEAYIQAMAAVLRKANCSDFALDTVRKAEQAKIQQALGLGLDPLPLEALVAAWTQQTGRPAAELEALLKVSDRKPTEPDLLKWLQNLQTVKKEAVRKG